MAGKSYLPAKDSDLQYWATNFLTVANANLPALGLVAADLTGITADKTSLDTSITNNKAKQAEAKAAADSKKSSRKKFETTARLLVRKIQANPSVTSDLKKKLGITAKDTNPTPINPIAPKDLLANPNANGTNKLSWDRNGNPQGTIFIIEAQEQPGMPWTFVGTTTKSVYEHTNQIPGKTLYYRVRAQRTDITSEPSNDAVVYANPIV